MKDKDGCGDGCNWDEGFLIAGGGGGGGEGIDCALENVKEDDFEDENLENVTEQLHQREQQQKQQQQQLGNNNRRIRARNKRKEVTGGKMGKCKERHGLRKENVFLESNGDFQQNTDNDLKGEMGAERRGGETENHNKTDEQQRYHEHGRERGSGSRSGSGGECKPKIEGEEKGESAGDSRRGEGDATAKTIEKYHFVSEESWPEGIMILML